MQAPLQKRQPTPSTSARSASPSNADSLSAKLAATPRQEAQRSQVNDLRAGGSSIAPNPVSQTGEQLSTNVGPVSFGHPIQCKSLLEAVGSAGTDKIAIAGEVHDEIDKRAEKEFWRPHGTKVVYENEIHRLRSAASSIEPVPMTFDDCAERALYSMETTLSWAKDFDYRKKGIPNGKKCKAAIELRELIDTHRDIFASNVDSVSTELKNMKGFNTAWRQRGLPARFTPAQIEATSALIKFFESFPSKAVETLSYEYVANDELVAGLRMKRVGQYIDAAETLFLAAKKLANVDEATPLSIARSETMYLNLRELSNLVSEKSIYKVGDKHAADMKQISNPVVEIKSRDEYLKETGLIKSPAAHENTRPPADGMLSGELISQKEKKAAAVAKGIGAL